MGKYSTLIERIPVYIALGQSNLDGRGYFPTRLVYGQNGDLSAEYKVFGTNDNMLIFSTPAWNTTKNGAWENFDLYVNNLNPDYGGVDVFGFESPFLKEMSDYKGKKVALIKATEGNTSLHTDWQTSGSTYQNASAKIQDGLQKVCSLGIPELKRVIWYQGYNDCSSLSYANAYEANLNGLISVVDTTVNQYLKQWNSKWTIVESPVWVDKYATLLEAWQDKLRLSQSNVGNSGDNNFLNNDNMSLFTDEIHLTGASYEQLGIDLFNLLKDE